MNLSICYVRRPSSRVVSVNSLHANMYPHRSTLGTVGSVFHNYVILLYKKKSLLNLVRVLATFQWYYKRLPEKREPAKVQLINFYVDSAI